MSANISVTKRQIKNRSGVDISVTSYEKAASAKQVKNYHVVVITSLPFYKLPQHSEEDIVQFMVPRDYEAFEKLQKQMSETFPELKLPSLPRKFHLFLDIADIEERQFAFDCLLKVFAKDKAMAVSVPMLQFLGFDLLADKKYYKGRRELLQRREEASKLAAEVSPAEDSLFGEVEESEDLFSTQKKQPAAHVGGSIFDDGSKTTSAKVSLLDSDDLFVATDSKTEQQQSSTAELEDNSELLNVSASLDDVLQVTKATSKSTAVKSVPGKSSSIGTGLFDLPDTAQVSEMGNDDILNYIAANQSSSDDLDLFS